MELKTVYHCVITLSLVYWLKDMNKCLMGICRMINSPVLPQTLTDVCQHHPTLVLLSVSLVLVVYKQSEPEGGWNLLRFRTGHCHKV